MSPGPERRSDRETACLAALAACISVVSFLLYFRNGDLLLYGDAVAHINIARRVFDSRTPGLLQLGTVWLPLPHLLMMPFLASRWAWQTGVGGSIPSMISYLLGVVGIFRLVRGGPPSVGRADAGLRVTAWLAAGIYGLNPNLLYLQATAMTESLYLAWFIWAVVYFGEFLPLRQHEGGEAQARRALWKCGACLAGACLTRYDGWFLACVLAGVVLGVCRAGGVGRATALRFVTLAVAVPLLWFAYNRAVYRNSLEFANGPYSARAIERKTAVSGFPPHPGTDNLPVAAAYFVKAAEFSVAEGWWQRAWLLLAISGSLYVVRDRRRLWLLLLWAPVPFYMLSVAYGGVPIFTPAWWPHSLYNLRYGVELLPAFTVFPALSAYFAVSFFSTDRAKRGIFLLAVGLVAASYASLWHSAPGCYREAWVNSRTRLQLETQLAEKLKLLPSNSGFLMYLGEHGGAVQEAGIPLRRAIHEGNHRVWKQPSDPEGMWERALADPSPFVDYVVAFEGDPVWQAVYPRGLPVVTTISVPGQRTVTIFRTR
jgi:hypothetical protein